MQKKKIEVNNKIFESKEGRVEEGAVVETNVKSSVLAGCSLKKDFFFEKI